MKRAARAIIGYLILGVITAFAVALGCWLLDVSFGSSMNSYRGTLRSGGWVGAAWVSPTCDFQAIATALCSPVARQVMAEEEEGVAEVEFYCTPDVASDPDKVLGNYHRDDYGLPYRMLRSNRCEQLEFVWVGPAGLGSISHSVSTLLWHSGVLLSDSKPRKTGSTDPQWVILPTTILRSGFTLNTLLYATLWFLVVLCAGWLFRHFRTPPGHCRNCRYNLTGLPASSLLCPECGNPILHTREIKSVNPRCHL